MKKVVILFGGNSFEHEVSCKSARGILTNIDKEKYEVIPVLVSKENDWYLYTDDYENTVNYNISSMEKIDNIIEFLKNIDVVFSIIHGNTSEDGKLQGLFDMFNIKYVGSNTLTNAVCYDKEFTKIIASHYDIPVVEYQTLHSVNDINKYKFEYPVIVKPVECGSSIGVNVCNNDEELNKNVKIAFEYSNKVIVEKFIKARELECAVLKTKDKFVVSTVGEITYDSDFYDYDAKYIKDSKLMIPSLIEKNIIEEIQKYAEKLVTVFNIEGLSRIDFLYDSKMQKVYLMEINTLPGFTEISMYPKLMDYEHISYKELITLLIESA